VAEFAHGRTERLCNEQAAQHAPDPKHRADLPFWSRPLASAPRQYSKGL
jgi:hypothetical protein